MWFLLDRRTWKAFAEAVKKALTIDIDWSQSLDGCGNENVRLNDSSYLALFCIAAAAYYYSYYRHYYYYYFIIIITIMCICVAQHCQY